MPMCTSSTHTMNFTHKYMDINHVQHYAYKFIPSPEKEGKG